MFSVMADYFSSQLKISRAYYVMQYKNVERAAKKGRKYNYLGAMIDLYLSKTVLGDTSFFETESGRKILDMIQKTTTIEEVGSGESKSFSVKYNRELVSSKHNELNIQKASQEFEKYCQLMDIHNNNALVSLLIRLESFFQDYFEWLVKKYPDKYLQDKNIKYAEILKYDFDGLKQQLTREAADAIMSQPLREWLRVIRSHKYKLDSLNPYLEEFNEIYYRRNIIVHNNGEVNRMYLSNVRGCKAELGTRLHLDRAYIMNAYSTSMIIVYGLLYATLKSNPDDLSDYLSFLFSTGFNHMLEGDWRIGKFIFTTLSQDQNQDEIDIVLSQINLWICRKNSGEFKEIKDEIARADYSAMNASIKMAKEMLLNNYDLGTDYLEEAIKSGQLAPDLVESWPIFIQYRKTNQYKLFRERHAMQIEDQSVRRDDLSISESDTNDECIQEIKDNIIQEIQQKKE